MSERRADLWCALLLLALVILLFADVLFLGNNFWFRDLFLYHFPLKRFVRQTIVAGEFPWWNPYLGGGQPMAANPAYEVFYPPQWLIFIGSYPFGFALHIVAHVYIAILGMYAFLRSIPLRLEASLFGALSFGMSGFFLGTMTNLPTFFVWSWAGAVSWGVLRLIRGGSVAPAAMAIAMPMLVLEPMALAQMLALMVAGAMFVDRRALPRVLGAIALAIALAAVVIIPAIDHAHDSARARGFPLSVVTDYSMPPARPLELLAPHAFGVLPDIHSWWGFRFFGPRGTPYLTSVYCGVAVAILAMAAAIRRQRGTGLLIGICAISYLLAIGSHTPLLGWFYSAGLRSIRYPEKFIAGALMSMIVFAAVAFDRISEIRKPLIVVATVVAVLLWIAASAMTPAMFVALWNRPPVLSSLARGTLVMAAEIATVWVVVFWRIGKSRVWMLAAFALLLIDLGSLSNEIAPRLPRSFFTPPPIVRALETGSTIFHRGEWTQPPIAKVYDRISESLSMRNALHGYSATVWGLRMALEPDFDETDLLPTHDLLNAMMRQGNSGDPHWSEKFASISNVRAIVDYRQGSIDDPLTAIPMPATGRFWFAKRGGRVVRALESSSSAALDVEAMANAFLIITITRHKYWQATIDGRPAELLPTNFAYQGLRLPAGRHRVELRYRNPLVIWSAAVSVLALLFVAAAESGRLVRIRRASRPAN